MLSRRTLLLIESCVRPLTLPTSHNQLLLLRIVPYCPKTRFSSHGWSRTWQIDCLSQNKSQLRKHARHKIQEIWEVGRISKKEREQSGETDTKKYEMMNICIHACTVVQPYNPRNIHKVWIFCVHMCVYTYALKHTLAWGFICWDVRPNAYKLSKWHKHVRWNITLATNKQVEQSLGT